MITIKERIARRKRADVENTEYILEMFPEYRTEPYVDTYTTRTPADSGVFVHPVCCTSPEFYRG